MNNLQNLPRKLFKLEREMNKGMKNLFIYLFKKRKIGSIAYQAGNFFFHACWTKNFLQSLPFPYTPLEKRINLFTCRACSSIREEKSSQTVEEGKFDLFFFLNKSWKKNIYSNKSIRLFQSDWEKLNRRSRFNWLVSDLTRSFQFSFSCLEIRLDHPFKRYKNEGIPVERRQTSIRADRGETNRPREE